MNTVDGVGNLGSPAAVDTDLIVEDFYRQMCLPGLLCSMSFVLECCAGF